MRPWSPWVARRGRVLPAFGDALAALLVSCVKRCDDGSCVVSGLHELDIGASSVASMHARLWLLASAYRTLPARSRPSALAAHETVWLMQAPWNVQRF